MEAGKQCVQIHKPGSKFIRQGRERRPLFFSEYGFTSGFQLPTTRYCPFTIVIERILLFQFQASIFILISPTDLSVYSRFEFLTLSIDSRIQK